MLRGEIILANGIRTEFYLNPDEIRKLEHQVKQQNEHYRKEGRPENYSMADELRYGISRHLADLPDPAQENETPAAGTAGESE